MRDEEIQHSGEDDLPINNDRRSGVSVAVRDSAGVQAALIVTSTVPSVLGFVKAAGHQPKYRSLR